MQFFSKKHKGARLIFLASLSVLSSKVQSSSLETPASHMQEIENSVENLTTRLQEKSQKFLQHRKETERVLAALLVFAKPSTQKSVLFSSSQDYTRVSLLLEGLAKKAQESLLDLKQEISELEALLALRSSQEKELVRLQKEGLSKKGEASFPSS